MSENVNVPKNRLPNLAAPTPQNTPLTNQGIAPQAVLSRPAVPTVEENDEEDEDEGDDDGRLATLVGQSSGYIENLPYKVRRRVEGLKGIQVEHTELQAKYHQEMLELEKKYNLLSEPLYKRRLAVIQGDLEPTDKEVEAGVESSKKEEDEDVFDEEEAKKKEEGDDIKGIPDFWLTALRNHVGISELITDRDEAAVRHLTEVTLAYLDSPAPGYKLSFHFSSNEFFTNSVLEKTYHYKEEVSYLGDWLYDHAEGTTIDWKEDKDLTKAVEIKKQRNKNTNRTRLIRKVIPTDSFFNFFAPPVPPTEEQMNDDDIDPEELEDIEERLELDYQIGEDIKDRIIPRAIDYFTGKALKYDGLDEDEDEDGEDEYDEEEGDFEDEDDDDLPANRQAPKDASQKPEECQQQ
ncbi:NAP-domain-containing protein [Dacryopinax primogenitus]|uniref:NAP-domain-containing protein n=1 Tax=Dacryopinax primogenitus (strain DJM 731) TaxID=1858805 RepID=M5G5X1_DACPD|nr:NAP-domain-containing protein [Dacryopinax primogenitus]EJT99157.1 NAP-domain-containing protein [Dacryopinax primogenitus]